MHEQRGVDSKVVTALASNSAGTIKTFQWDGSPCGGPGCDPVTDVQTCIGPTVNDQLSQNADALPIGCESFGLAERTCG